jgi:hypothetical protein
MIWAIAAEYPGLPDPRGLNYWEIRFWYEGIRERLKTAAAEAAKMAAKKAGR